MDIHLPPDQEARLAAIAASEGRSTNEVIREAVTLWEEWHAPVQPKHTPAEAAARLLELRVGNFLHEGETIKDLIDFGRA